MIPFDIGHKINNYLSQYQIKAYQSLKIIIFPLDYLAIPPKSRTFALEINYWLTKVWGLGGAPFFILYPLPLSSRAFPSPCHLERSLPPVISSGVERSLHALTLSRDDKIKSVEPTKSKPLPPLCRKSPSLSQQTNQEIG